MNKVEIKKAVGVIQNELTKYGLMTPGKGIDFKVSIMVEQMPNDRGRMVPHMVAKWDETFPLCVDETILYRESETSKCEEMNRYFNAELFVNGITQRAKWIQAKHEDRVAYLEENPFGHPALYPVWAESRHVAA
tara:strand:- start:717 stop:1118 length:402 start_codon:yes stop_codon:yes gene_type:complete